MLIPTSGESGPNGENNSKTITARAIMDSIKPIVTLQRKKTIGGKVKSHTPAQKERSPVERRKRHQAPKHDTGKTGINRRETFVRISTRLAKHKAAIKKLTRTLKGASPIKVTPSMIRGITATMNIQFMVKYLTCSFMLSS